MEPRKDLTTAGLEGILLESNKIMCDEDIIDALFECVRESDWNGCGNSTTLISPYEMWNKLSYPKKDSLSIQNNLKLRISENKKFKSTYGELINSIVLRNKLVVDPRKYHEYREKAKKYDELKNKKGIDDIIRQRILIINEVEFSIKTIWENAQKAKKYDACGNLITQVNELLRENKQLKEGLQVHRKELDRYQKLYTGLKYDFDDLANSDNKLKESYRTVYFGAMEMEKKLKEIKQIIASELYSKDVIEKIYNLVKENHD